jgi:predicted TIM-barrel fold metal-dependent hydrolase
MAAAATLAATSSRSAAATASETISSSTRIDTNVTLFQWPGRRLPYDDPASLVRKLERHGITQAWAGSFDGLLQRDIAGVNARLADACGASGGRLIPFGSINPMLPNWEADLQRCAEAHRMRGVRLHPNYHGYTLRDARFKQLIAVAAERRLLVQVVASLRTPARIFRC